MIWFGWALSPIKHCRLFNAKSGLYIYIKYIYVNNDSVKHQSYIYTQLKDKTVLLQTIQFIIRKEGGRESSVCTQFKRQTVLFNP